MSESEGRSLFGSIFFTHLVLVLHALVIVLLALLVVFFRGVVEYMAWIVGGGFAIFILIGILIWLRIRRSRREISELLQSPLLQDRSVELKFLGGLASVKLGEPTIQHRAAGPALDYQAEQRLELSGPANVDDVGSRPPQVEPDPSPPQAAERVIDLEAETVADEEPPVAPAVEPMADAETERLRNLARLVKLKESGSLSEQEFRLRKEELER
ncbi:MAG: hypothetical protein C0616_02205 [Desulfuromonas sp.]|nr:MAG: hypothetical protein C0616_02205 [Desulfuromonas sp.]